jgi:hypothetical protein
MNVYFGRDRQNLTEVMTATHATVRSLTRRVEVVDHKLCMDNFFSSPDIFDDLHTRGINCCGTVRQNHEGMPRGIDGKTLILKHGDTCAKVRDNLTAIV